MKKSQVQIPAREYFELDYLDKPRWISYWQQVHEVDKTKPKKILEVGVGNGLVENVLQKLGYKVETLDIDKKVHPTYLGDIRQIPLAANSYDTILCAQVLEHIPYVEVSQALKELHRVSKKYVVLTLPHDYLTYFSLTIKCLPFVRQLTFFKIIDSRRKHVFNGQHYWEIGKKNYPLMKIKKLIEQSKFIVNNTYCLPENPYHRFFILEKY